MVYVGAELGRFLVCATLLFPDKRVSCSHYGINESLGMGLMFDLYTTISFVSFKFMLQNTV
jgi:hypothetical protein